MKPLKPMLALMMCLAIVFALGLAYLLLPAVISPFRPTIGTHSIQFAAGGVRASHLMVIFILAPLVVWIIYRLRAR
jgi:hypothetical protein